MYLKRALYIGRFQPFHNGHKDALLQILKRSDIDKVYIGIGSSEENFTDQNPLTTGERMEIIESVLHENNIPAERWAIVPLRNIHHYALWPYHVQQNLPKIDVFCSGSPLVQMLWKKAFPETEIFPLQKNIAINASSIREMLVQGNEISNFVPYESEKLLTKFQIAERIKNMKTE